MHKHQPESWCGYFGQNDARDTLGDVRMTWSRNVMAGESAIGPQNISLESLVIKLDYGGTEEVGADSAQATAPKRLILYDAKAPSPASTYSFDPSASSFDGSESVPVAADGCTKNEPRCGSPPVTPKESIPPNAGTSVSAARLPKFTSDWFDHHASNWSRWFEPLTQKESPLVCLEVGTWEGRSALWIVDNLVSRGPPGSHLYCVDRWLPDEVLPGTDGSVTGADAYSTCIENLRVHLDSGIATVLRGESADVLPALCANQNIGKLPALDFVYVDGSTLAAEVLTDAVLCFHMLDRGGYMVFDDYEWNYFADERSPRLAIDAFLKCFSGQYDLVHKGSQIVVQKVKPSKELEPRRSVTHRPA